MGGGHVKRGGGWWRVGSITSFALCGWMLLSSVSIPEAWVPYHTRQRQAAVRNGCSSAMHAQLSRLT